MNRQSITPNKVRKGADAQAYSICGVFFVCRMKVDLSVYRHCKIHFKLN